MFITILLKTPPILKGISSTDDHCFFCRIAASFNKALKRENLQLAVFTQFNILANYKFPLSGALAAIREYMPKFEMETYLAIDTNLLAQDSFRMSGVNYELGPILKMSAPDNWYSKSINEWPTGQSLFCSTIYLFGVIPIDRHYFKFSKIDGLGFLESSNSLMNSLWSHERTIKIDGSGSLVKDIVFY
jgi:hypothetical protein